MRKNYYTEDEIVLCTYAALYDADDFGDKQSICTLTGRPVSSIDAKIRNFAALLDEKNIPRISTVTPLMGRTTGEGARPTNWDVVEPLTRLTKADLLQRCRGLTTNSQTT